MKKTVILAALLMSAIGAHAQGTVQFVNNSGTAFRAPVYIGAAGEEFKQGNTGAGIPAGTQTYLGALAAGTGYTAALWAKVGTGQTEASLDQIATTSFRTGTAAGFMTAVTATVPNSPIDGNAYSGTFQVRAWDNRGGTITTWAAVLADPTIASGKSTLFDAGPLGGTGTPPATPPLLTGLRSFNLVAAPVPEPSVIALGALGLGALLLRRIRK
ncbi:MAG: hypothetical protein RJA22_1343 [Verrucomicrobiota bacterium]|jgi:hypothetical protein